MASPILQLPFLTRTTSRTEPLIPFSPLSLTHKPTKIFRHSIHVKQQQRSIKCHAVTDLSSSTLPSSVDGQSKGGDNDDRLVLVGASSEEERRGEREVADYDWTEEWYPLYLTKDVPDDAPLGLTVFDKQVVLYKDGQGELRCFEDRCPHRPTGQGKSMLIVTIGGTTRPQIETGFTNGSFISGVHRARYGIPVISKSGFNERKVPSKILYHNLRSSDTQVAEYRKLMDIVGHVMPYRFGENPVSLPKLVGLIAGAAASFPAKGGIGTMHTPNLANRYFRHVIHCKACSSAFSTWKKAPFAISHALTALAILVSGRQWKAAFLDSTSLCPAGVYPC